MSGGASCVTGASLSDPSLCPILNIASTTPLSGPDVVPPESVQNDVLPGPLIQAINTGSDLIGYNFETQNVVRADAAQYTVDTYTTSLQNSAVLVKKPPKTTGTISNALPLGQKLEPTDINIGTLSGSTSLTNQPIGLSGSANFTISMDLTVQNEPTDYVEILQNIPGSTWPIDNNNKRKPLIYLTGTAQGAGSKSIGIALSTRPGASPTDRNVGLDSAMNGGWRFTPGSKFKFTATHNAATRTITMYINGVKKCETTMPTAMVYSTTNNFTWRPSAWNTSGAIVVGNVYWWSRVLTDVENLALQNVSLPVTPVDPKFSYIGTVFSTVNGAFNSFTGYWTKPVANDESVDVYYNPDNVSRRSLDIDGTEVDPPLMSTPPGYELPDLQASTITGGNLLISFGGVRTIDECANQCDDTPTCSGFNFGGLDTSTVCELVSDTTTRQYVDNKVGFKKESIPTAQTGDGNNPSGTDLTNQGVYCENVQACNTDISRLLNENASSTDPIQSFSTSDIDSCAYCPVRTYFRSGNVTTNELGVSKQNATVVDAYNQLKYENDGSFARKSLFEYGKFYEFKNWQSGQVIFRAGLVSDNNIDFRLVMNTMGMFGKTSWALYSAGYMTTTWYGPDYYIPSKERTFPWQANTLFQFDPVEYVANGFIFKLDGILSYISGNKFTQMNFSKFSYEFNNAVYTATEITAENFYNSYLNSSNTPPPIFKKVDTSEWFYVSLINGQLTYQKIQGIARYMSQNSASNKWYSSWATNTFFNNYSFEGKTLVGTNKVYDNGFWQLMTLGSDIWGCTPPAPNQYVITPCTATTDTVLGTIPACPTLGQYRAGYNQGTIETAGVQSSGTCTACSTPGTNQYVITPCTATTDTVFGTVATCPAGQWRTGFIVGTVTGGGGTPGSCTPCTSPGPDQFVSQVCGPTSDTVLTSMTCSSGYYRSGTDPGAYDRLGSSCIQCRAPSATDGSYVTSICSGTSDTGIAGRCPLNQYRANFTVGTPTSLGTPGTCTPCTAPTPGTLQYIATACTRVADSVISTVSACPTGQYRPGFSVGTIGTATVVPTAGSPGGTCTPCTVPSSTSGQYVKTVCTTTSDSEISDPCPSLYYRTGGYNTGTTTATGTPGTCTACTGPYTDASGIRFTVTPCTATTDTVLTSYLSYCDSGKYAYGLSLGSQYYRGSWPLLSCATCSTPGTNQYVSSACTQFIDTGIATVQACLSGQYRSGYIAGTATSVGAQGTCTACSAPGPNQYVRTACTLTSDTDIQAAVTCTAGSTYRTGYTAGTATTTGTPGTCTTCTAAPTAASGRYVRTACTATSDTDISDVCIGGFRTGYTVGTATSAGTAGTCTACSVPTGTFDYVTSVCTPTTNTVIATVAACSTTNQYRTGFSAGSATVAGAAGTCTTCTQPNSAIPNIVTSLCTRISDTVLGYVGCGTNNYRTGYTAGTPATTLGTYGACAACSVPTGTFDYVTSVCTATTNTVIATVAACSPTNQYRTGFRAGSATAAGAAGTCTTCSTPSLSTSQYVSAICTRISDTQISNQNLTTCGSGKYKMFGSYVFSHGNWDVLGYSGTEASYPSCYSCSTWSAPTSAQYVSSICDGYSRLLLENAAACTAGSTYRTGYTAGTATTTGTPGTCTACTPIPSATEGKYVISPCTPTSDAVISGICGSGTIRTGFTVGGNPYAGTPGTCTACTTPGANQYVKTLCSGTTNTELAAAVTCTAGSTYRTGYTAGTATTTGTPGTCTTCTAAPTAASGKYVTAACTTTSDTVISGTCPSGQYRTGYTVGTAASAGTPGTCTACSVPTAGSDQYVTAACTATTNTTIGTVAACPTAGQYRSGFSAGTATTVGTIGTCTACTAAPTAASGKYVTAACTTTSDTVISGTCPSGQYRTGYTVGTATSVGTPGTCTACTEPTLGQYVTSVCGGSVNTATGTTTTCGSTSYRISYTRGSSTSIGQSGSLCTACSAPSAANFTYTLTPCNGYENTVLRNVYCPGKLVNGVYVNPLPIGYSSGSVTTVGSPGTSCPP